MEAYEYVGDPGIGGSALRDGARESEVVAMAGLLILLYTAAATCAADMEFSRLKIARELQVARRLRIGNIGAHLFSAKC